jgi:hypothetical protein
MTKRGRPTRAAAFAAMLAIIGVTAVTASATAARAWDRQASDATEDDAVNRQAAGLGDAVALRSGPYANARRDRRGMSPSAKRKDVPDIK